MIKESKVNTDSTEDIESIQNWTIWKPSCSISLWKDIEDNTYNAAIDIFLTDEPIRCVTTMTEIWCNNPLCAIRQAFECVYNLYGDVNETVNVINFFDGELVEEYTISQALDDEYCNRSEEIAAEM